MFKWQQHDGQREDKQAVEFMSVAVETPPAAAEAPLVRKPAVAGFIQIEFSDGHRRACTYGSPLGITDMRKGFDGPTALIQEAMSEDPVSGRRPLLIVIRAL